MKSGFAGAALNSNLVIHLRGSTQVQIEFACHFLDFEIAQSQRSQIEMGFAAAQANPEFHRHLLIEPDIPLLRSVSQRRASVSRLLDREASIPAGAAVVDL